MNKSLFTRLVIVLIVAAASWYYVYPPFDVKVGDKVVREGKLKLGLDLEGGSSFLLQVDTIGASERDRDRALNKAVEIIRRRIDRSGVREPVIQKVGESQINVQIPGVTEEQKKQARSDLQRVAKLEFRLVHPNSDSIIKRHLDAGEALPPGYEIKKGIDPSDKPNQPATTYNILVRKSAALSGKHISRARPDRTESGQPYVSIQFTSEGAELFGVVTSQLIDEEKADGIPRRLAIVMEDEVKSAPTVQAKITTGSAQITGKFTWEEVDNLVSDLENPLETPVKIIEEREVGPYLAKDSIRDGIRAAVWGTLFVIIFMLIYYSVAGLVANAALCLNLLITLGVLGCFKASLTLPGIAGIVLTLGMAVDANVLIYERIREELRNGKGFKNALAAGYSRAFLTIIDSHVTTLLIASILIYFGSGPIRGFGITLAIGLSVSLFTALFVTRLIFDFLTENNLLSRIPMMHIVQGTNINFLKMWKPAAAVSILIIVVGLSYGYFKRGHEVMGIDFAGGDEVVLKVGQKVEESILNKTMLAAGVKEPSPQYQLGSDGQQLLRITTEHGAGRLVDEVLKKEFPQAGFVTYQIQQVGPSVGKAILGAALISILVALVGILLYVSFRFELPFAVGAVAGVVHDVLVTLAIFILLGNQFSAPIVAAILTIIGFSINDTIVVFDRIRENLHLHPHRPLEQTINDSVNQTLGRTILTSGTVFLATLALYLFGGGVLRDFALTFMIGVIVGTGSSVFVCSPVMLMWARWRKHDLKSEVSSAARRSTGASELP
ncbi:MAG: protein translocase subunit SecD [Verrucomicrobiota bacterium]|nr:protein translocase subunit SecD [Verrucomicrobiota bacterium]